MTAPVEHPVLDHIVTDLHVRQQYVHHRESECVEFYDSEQDQWFEIAVRPIDSPSSDGN